MSRKIYAAIGHFKDEKNIIRSIVFEQRTKKDFMTDCYGNGFVPYVVMTEAMLDKIFAFDCSMDVYEQVKKLTTNYRVWNTVTDYLTQAGYLITDKVKEIKERA